MVTLHRTNSDNQDFRRLIILLDQGLAERNGAQQSWYDQYNVIKAINTVVVARIADEPAGCGCFKPFDHETVEIKRMFVKPENRGQGIAKGILRELEQWAAEAGFSKAVLETGRKQLEAINLYTKSGYTRIENFGQYAGVEHSLCFAKRLGVLKLRPD